MTTTHREHGGRGRRQLHHAILVHVVSMFHERRVRSTDLRQSHGYVEADDSSVEYSFSLDSRFDDFIVHFLPLAMSKLGFKFCESIVLFG